MQPHISHSGQDLHSLRQVSKRMAPAASENDKSSHSSIYHGSWPIQSWTPTSPPYGPLDCLATVYQAIATVVKASFTLEHGHADVTLAIRLFKVTRCMKPSCSNSLASAVRTPLLLLME